MDSETGAIEGIQEFEPDPKASQICFRQQSTPERNALPATWNSLQTADQKDLEASFTSSRYADSDFKAISRPPHAPPDASWPLELAVYADWLHLTSSKANSSSPHSSTKGDQSRASETHRSPSSTPLTAIEVPTPVDLNEPNALRTSMNNDYLVQTPTTSRASSIHPLTDHNSHPQSFKFDKGVQHDQERVRPIAFQYQGMVKAHRELRDQQGWVARQRVAFLDQLRMLLSSLSGSSTGPDLMNASLPDTPRSTDSGPLIDLNDHVGALQVQAANLGLAEADFVQGIGDFLGAFRPATPERGSFALYDDPFTIPPSPTESFASIESEDLDLEAREYHDLVGNINIIRERLNEFEIAHRNDIDTRRAHAKGERILDIEDLEMIALPQKNFDNQYFAFRCGMVKDLLTTWKRAISLRRYCLQNSINLWEPDGLNALEEAVKYNFDGDIGRMYAMHHEGTHVGLRPLELLQVPFLHTEDRIKRWLWDVNYSRANTSPHAVQRATETVAQEHFFDLHYSTPKPWHSPAFGPQEPLAPHAYGLEVYGEQPHWPVWAGEYTSRTAKARPASDPGIIGQPSDQFASWLGDGVHSCMLQTLDDSLASDFQTNAEYRSEDGAIPE